VNKIAITSTLIAWAMAGCASQPNMAFVRVDGQSFEENPTYKAQFDSDLTGCRETTSSFRFFEFGQSEIGNSCMEEKGYVEVSQDQAEVVRAEILAKKDLERVANLPPLPDKKPQRVGRRQTVLTVSQKKRPVPQEARPISAKPKTKTLTNPLKLPD
jgi:hypothetical protein